MRILTNGDQVVTNTDAEVKFHPYQVQVKKGLRGTLREVFYAPDLGDMCEVDFKEDGRIRKMTIPTILIDLVQETQR